DTVRPVKPSSDFIDKNGDEILGAADFLFTFEPRTRKVDCSRGFKHENIYFFDSDGRAR
ncbi:MAG: hypothetical protein ACI92E_002943, partial [Oceanicoccus sp.]